MPTTCSAVPAPARATDTNGVAMPSLSPLSTLISRRILAGTTGLAIIPAPSAASVGAKAAPTIRANQMLVIPVSASASSVPRAIVSGSPIPSSRRYKPRSARSPCSPTRDASQNNTSTRVISASALIISRLGWTPRGANGPWVRTSPAPTNVIGAVTSNRSSRADSAPQANISAATIARSESLMISPSASVRVRRACSSLHSARMVAGSGGARRSSSESIPAAHLRAHHPMWRRHKPFVEDGDEVDDFAEVIGLILIQHEGGDHRPAGSSAATAGPGLPWTPRG